MTASSEQLKVGADLNLSEIEELRIYPGIDHFHRITEHILRGRPQGAR